MPTPFKVTVRLNIPREQLWRIRASKTFMDFLVSNGALTRMEASPATQPQDAETPTQRTRRQTYIPGDVVIPDIVKPIIDDSYIEIQDVQLWDEAKPYIQNSMIRPAILGDVVTTTACLSLEEDVEINDDGANNNINRDENDNNIQLVNNSNDVEDNVAKPVESESNSVGCLHTLTGNVTVGVPFIGYYVEQAIVANMNQFYSYYPAHVDDFISVLVNKYGDGSRASLNSAIDRMLADEKAL